MIAVIVALCVFFVVVAMVELLPSGRKPATQTTDAAPEEPSISRPVPLACVTSYWEQDRSGWWRLWNLDRKNLGVVAWQDTHVLWRVFTTDLLPSQGGYELVELEGLLTMGIRSFAPSALTPTIEGKTGSEEEAMQQVEATINYIRGNYARVSS